MILTVAMVLKSVPVIVAWAQYICICDMQEGMWERGTEEVLLGTSSRSYPICLILIGSIAGISDPETPFSVIY